MKSIPTFKLVPEPVSQEARDLSGFKWANPKVGTRHQLGGKPELVDEGDWPRCPGARCCGWQTTDGDEPRASGHGKMTFYAQLDSINDDICIADCGMIQVFLCFDCFATKSVVQSG